MIFDGLAGIDRTYRACARVIYSKQVDKKAAYDLHDQFAKRLDLAIQSGQSVPLATHMTIWELWKLAPIDGPISHGYVEMEQGRIIKIPMY
jgi:hypothetical protein